MSLPWPGVLDPGLLKDEVVAQLPHGRLRSVDGQTHMVRAKPLTPVLLDHFGLA